MFRYLLSVSVLAIVISGCSSSPNKEFAAELKEREKIQEKVQERYEKKEQKKRKEEVKLLPKWVLNPPQSDATGVYGVGISESRSLGHALKVARLQAEFSLAKVYKQELSGSERAFEQGDSEGNVATQTTFLIDKLVDSVPVVGYQVVEQEVKPNRGLHNVYVLLKLPYDEFNKILQQEKAKTLDNKVRASFDDLERRLDKRRRQRLEDDEVEFTREQEALANRAKLLDDEPETEETESEGSLE